MNTITKWTPDVINKLKKLIGTKTNSYDIAKIMGFTRSAIMSKCYELRLSLNYNNSTINWNDNNIKKLIKLNDEKKSHVEIAEIFGFPIWSIHKKLSNLKIKSKNVNYLTEEEKKQLIELFEKGYSINYIAKILNRGSPYLCNIPKKWD